MVRIEIGGHPIIDVDTVPGDAGRLKEHVRRRIRGSGRRWKLSWNTARPRIVLASDTDEFDPTIVSHFQEEGFQLSYLQYDGDHGAFDAQLQHLQDPLELGEQYAIVGRCAPCKCPMSHVPVPSPIPHAPARRPVT